MPGWRAVIDNITQHCHPCAALRKLPKVLLEDSSETPHSLASNFAADIVERCSPKILILRENFLSYTRAQLIPDQTASLIKKSLLSLILDIVPESGTEIRVDSAPAFQTLYHESQQDGSILNKLKIKIVLCRVLNKNKNPTCENANQELQKEIL